MYSAEGKQAGPKISTYVGPDLGSSLFAILQQYWCLSILNRMGLNKTENILITSFKDLISIKLCVVNISII